jgi:hypothetical protein
MRASAAEKSRLWLAAAAGAGLLCFGALHPGSALAASRSNMAQHPVEEAPLPPPRPESKADETAGGEETHAETEAPLPPPRPADSGKPAPAAAVPSPEILAEETACLGRLTTLGVRFEPAPAIVDGQCGARSPLRVSALPDGLQISSPATLVCAAAEALARWTREVVAVEAARHLETQPTRIAIGTSYECRNQNRQASGKLSEHAFANGVDISGFEFKGRKALQIGDHPAETPEALFQNAIRTQACAYFTTVLGPGSDAAHATHLHLDLRGRGRGFRLCQ